MTRDDAGAERGAVARVAREGRTRAADVHAHQPTTETNACCGRRRTQVRGGHRDVSRSPRVRWSGSAAQGERSAARAPPRMQLRTASSSQVKSATAPLLAKVVTLGVLVGSNWPSDGPCHSSADLERAGRAANIRPPPIPEADAGPATLSSGFLRDAYAGSRVTCECSFGSCDCNPCARRCLRSTRRRAGCRCRAAQPCSSVHPPARHDRA